MIGVMDVYRQECSKLGKYIDENKDDELVKIIYEAENRKTYGLTSYLCSKDEGTVESINTEHYEGLKAKEMHGD